MSHELSHGYSIPLVTLSVIVAMLASYTALDLAGRVHSTTGRSRRLWILGGAVALGTGIWTMHFVGMLAFQVHMPVTYDAFFVTASIVVAVAASAFALWNVAREKVGLAQLAVAASALGIAIAGMHYVGMEAMELDAELTYRWGLWWSSIGIAVGASFVALVLARRLGVAETSRIRAYRVASAVVMGLAIAGMHYTGMAAVRLTPMDHAHVASELAMPHSTLTIAILTAGGLIIGLALLAAQVDRLLNTRAVAAELRAAKDAAECTSRAKSEFLSNMSHELRTPLNSVIGFANVLLKNKGQNLSPQDIAYLGRIVANGRHLLGLINGILDLSKIEAGRVDLEVGAVDVPQLVRDTVAELEGQAQGRDLALVADVTDQVSLIDTDGAKLKQILINLIGNALKFTATGRVTVRVVRDDLTGEPARIDVVDTGIGIPDDRLSAIFEAFQQADSSTSRQYGGTGLGLTITRSLALLMGFDIRVTSTVGVGSTFSVVMKPWDAAPDHRRPLLQQEPVRRRTGQEGAIRPLLTLIVDDDADARTLMGQQLTELGCDVVTAASADEGLALARKLRPDLITLDVMMPRKSGIEALHEFKTDPLLRDIPVVVVSMVAQNHRGRVIGAVDCLDKPVTREALAAVLQRNVVAEHAPRILVVHDDGGPAQRYEDLLLADGVPVDLAHGPTEAQAMIASRGIPAAIVIDVNDPRADVFEWLAVIREDRRTLGVPVAVVVPAAIAKSARKSLAGQATVRERAGELRSDLHDIIGSLRGRRSAEQRHTPVNAVRAMAGGGK